MNKKTDLNFLIDSASFFKKQTQPLNLSKLTLMKPIAKGNQGTIFKVKYNGKKMALKMIGKKFILKNPFDFYLLEREILLKSVNANYLLSSENFFYDSMNLYFLTEYYSGDLLDFIDLNIKDLLPQVVEGINELHRLGFIHRDIKLENILIRGNKIKITDFGSACRICGEKSNLPVGTPDFISPEIIMNRPYSERTDWWSFGCLLYYVEHKVYPFNADRLVEIYSLISNITYERRAGEYSSLVERLLVYEEERIGYGEIRGEVKGGDFSIEETSSSEYEECYLENEEVIDEQFVGYFYYKEIEKYFMEQYGIADTVMQNNNSCINNNITNDTIMHNSNITSDTIMDNSNIPNDTIMQNNNSCINNNAVHNTNITNDTIMHNTNITNTDNKHNTNIPSKHNSNTDNKHNTKITNITSKHNSNITSNTIKHNTNTDNKHNNINKHNTNPVKINRETVSYLNPIDITSCITDLRNLKSDFLFLMAHLKQQPNKNSAEEIAKLKNEIYLLKQRTEKKHQLNFSVKIISMCCRFELLNIFKKNSTCQLQISKRELQIDSYEERLYNVLMKDLPNRDLPIFKEKERSKIAKLIFLSAPHTQREQTVSRDDLRSKIAKDEELLAKMATLQLTNTKAVKNLSLYRKSIEERIANNQQLMTSSTADSSTGREKAVAEYKGHQFRREKIKELCYFCDNRLICDSGYRCLDCKMVVHESCYLLVEENCEIYQMVQRGKVLYIMFRSGEEKERCKRVFLNE